MIIHGNRDDVAPLEQAQRLFEAAAEPKRFYIVEGAGHSEIFAVGRERYLEALRDFVLGEVR